MFLQRPVVVLGILVLTSIPFGTADYVVPSVWPMPADMHVGQTTVFVSKGLVFNTNNGTNVKTIDDAYERYRELMFNHAYGDDSGSPIATEVAVAVADISEEYPQLDTDESYTLTISDGGIVSMTAETVYGVLRGLETLSQLIMYDYDRGAYIIHGCPLRITDAPRYPHRGLLLDTSRHFQPLKELQRTIDALSYAKYNVLHWHVVDSQSFPFQSHVYPNLWDGAYTPAERYRQEDIVALVEYGRNRGVKVMIEFDIPGHAASWCTGYPEICPSPTCLQPLNPASEVTFELIEAVLGECTGSSPSAGMFPYSFLHLGGDEVDYTCWTSSKEIQAWAKQNGMSSNEDIYKYFLDRAASIARNQGRVPVQWVEVFEHFGSSLDKDTLVHVWKDKSTLDQVLSAGYKALLSNQNMWYLDWLDTSWKTMYNNEPTDGLSVSSDPSLILGGESCMWGETVDPSDLDATIWPRAAAVSERLWSPKEKMDVVAAEDRLQTFRCILESRGIGAAPVKNTQARSNPPNPGSCFLQRRY